MESEKHVTFSVKRCEGVNNCDCLPVIHRRRLENDAYRSLIKRWASLAEGHVDVKTADGHLIRISCIAMASRKMSQFKKTSFTRNSYTIT